MTISGHVILGSECDERRNKVAARKAGPKSDLLHQYLSIAV